MNRGLIMRLGDRLKKEREKRGWSQIFVANKVGITNTVLSNYERNYRDPDTDTLKKLADLYEVYTDDLLGRTLNYDVDRKNHSLTKEEMARAIVEKAGEPGSKERDRLSEIFLEEFEKLPDPAKKTVIELMRQIRKTE